MRQELRVTPQVVNNFEPRKCYGANQDTFASCVSAVENLGLQEKFGATV